MVRNYGGLMWSQVHLQFPVDIDTTSEFCASPTVAVWLRTIDLREATICIAHSSVLCFTNSCRVAQDYRPERGHHLYCSFVSFVLHQQFVVWLRTIDLREATICIAHLSVLCFTNSCRVAQDYRPERGHHLYCSFVSFVLHQQLLRVPSPS
ncbi:hypothetical protein J6590_103218 [Homalodisca vitripennis]|nr:hypothetical protein J6590_103218 [Homalodisca vitripennis]